MANEDKFRILVVDDSVVMRTLIADLIQQDGSVTAIGYASNGKEALLKCKELKPDLVLMDMIMGDSDGLEGVKLIMKDCPTPVIMLSSLDNNEASPIMEAMKAGAVDYHKKPDRTVSDFSKGDCELMEKIRQAISVKVAPIQASLYAHLNNNAHTFDKVGTYHIIVIGSSTGGPSAVESVLLHLPKNLNVPVVIAQHMPENFIHSFAKRLNDLTDLRVIVAQKGMAVESGNVYIAPGNENTIVNNTKNGNQVVFDYTPERFKEFNNPSVTALMNSVAAVYGGHSIAVMLTGMGRDGTPGMKAIYDAGGYTIAQSKESCVVFGMPGSAVEAGAVKKIVPIDQIGPFIVGCLDC